MADPQLLARDFWRTTDHAVFGARPVRPLPGAVEHDRPRAVPRLRRLHRPAQRRGVPRARRPRRRRDRGRHGRRALRVAGRRRSPLSTARRSATLTARSGRARTWSAHVRPPAAAAAFIDTSSRAWCGDVAAGEAFLEALVGDRPRRRDRARRGRGHRWWRRWRRGGSAPARRRPRQRRRTSRRRCPSRRPTPSRPSRRASQTRRASVPSTAAASPDDATIGTTIETGSGGLRPRQRGHAQCAVAQRPARP